MLWVWRCARYGSSDGLRGMSRFMGSMRSKPERRSTRSAFFMSLGVRRGDPRGSHILNLRIRASRLALGMDESLGFVSDNLLSRRRTTRAAEDRVGARAPRREALWR